jgi:hypothetical protein
VICQPSPTDASPTSRESAKDDRAHDRPLHDPREAGRGRHGRRLQGPGRPPGPARGAQGAARRQGGGSRAPATLRPGGEGRLRPEPSQHRHDPRHQRGRRHRLHRHGVRGGQGPRRAHPAARHASRRGPEARRRDRRRPRRRARRRDRPPRLQAGKRDGGLGRPGQGGGLRPGEAGGPGRRQRGRRHGGGRGPAPDGGGSPGRDRGIHVAGAGGGQEGRRALGHLLLRSGALRDGDGATGVPGGLSGIDARRGAPGRAKAGDPGGRRPARRGRPRHHPLPPKGPGAAFSGHGRPQGRPAGAEGGVGLRLARRTGPGAASGSPGVDLGGGSAGSSRLPRRLPPVPCLPERNATAPADERPAHDRSGRGRGALLLAGRQSGGVPVDSRARGPRHLRQADRRGASPASHERPGGRPVSRLVAGRPVDRVRAGWRARAVRRPPRRPAGPRPGGTGAPAGRDRAFDDRAGGGLRPLPGVAPGRQEPRHVRQPDRGAARRPVRPVRGFRREALPDDSAAEHERRPPRGVSGRADGGVRPGRDAGGEPPLRAGALRRRPPRRRAAAARPAGGRGGQPRVDAGRAQDPLPSRRSLPGRLEALGRSRRGLGGAAASRHGGERLGAGRRAPGRPPRLSRPTGRQQYLAGRPRPPRHESRRGEDHRLDPFRHHSPVLTRRLENRVLVGALRPQRDLDLRPRRLEPGAGDLPRDLLGNAALVPRWAAPRVRLTDGGPGRHLRGGHRRGGAAPGDRRSGRRRRPQRFRGRQVDPVRVDTDRPSSSSGPAPEAAVFSSSSTSPKTRRGGSPTSRGEPGSA